MTDEQEQELRKRWLWWRFALRYGIGLVVLVFYVTTSFHFQYTPDDTYVYLQYGRNIARGEGFSFNVGTPSYGITSPVWALLIAGGTKLSLDPYIVAKTLDIVFASLAVIGVLAFAFVMIRDRIYALIAAWIFSFDAWYLRWSGSGLESSLAVLLVVLTLWYAYRKEYVTAAFIVGILTLVRPEGVLLFLAVLVDAYFNARGRRAAIRAIVGSFFLYTVVVGCWMIYTFVEFGTIVPNALASAWGDGPSVATVGNGLISDFKLVGATQFVLAGFLVLGVALTFWRREILVLREEGFPLLWLLSMPMLTVLMDVHVASRSLLLVMPVVVIYGVWGLKRLEVASYVTPRRGLTILMVVAGISLFQNQLVYRLLVIPQMENFETGATECLKPMAYWLRSNTPEGSSVLTPDPGIIGYVSERTVYDAAGRITPEVRKAFEERQDREGVMEMKYDSLFHPDYVIDSSPVAGRLTSDKLSPVMTRPFSGAGSANTGALFYTLYKVIK